MTEDKKKALILTGVVGGIAGAVVAGFRLLTADVHAPKDTPPDEPLNIPPPGTPPTGKSGWKRVDAILPQLKDAAQKSGVPLGLLVGWIAKESGGKLAVYKQPGPGDTSMDERGYFQLTPEESKSLGLDHERLSTDSTYSIDAGIKLIRKYQSTINNLDLEAAPAGNNYYWRLVKLAHSMGSGQIKKVVNAAKDASRIDSWDTLENFAWNMHVLGPQPKKWFPFVDEVYRVGMQFGFGGQALTYNVGSALGTGLDLLGADYV